MNYESQEAISTVGNKVIKVTQYGERKTHTICVDRPEKIIICFPSQIGCIGKCIFCKSSKIDYIKNLTNSNMLDHCLYSAGKMDIVRKPILFSCMGEGDPLCNIMGVLTTMHLLYSYFPTNSKFALSTSVPSKDLFNNILCILPFLSFKLKIQVSLHSVVEETRKKMMPHSISVSDILGIIKEVKVDPEKIELNFVLLKDINDSFFHAKKIIADLGPGSKIKINKFNNFLGSNLQESTVKDDFIYFLRDEGMIVEEYVTDESPLKSGCGIATSE